MFVKSKQQSFLKIFFLFIILSTIYFTSIITQNIQLIDSNSEKRQLPKLWDYILNDLERTPTINWWHFILVFIVPIIVLVLIVILIYFCFRWYKWFRARREAFLQAWEARKIKRSRSRSRSLSRKSTSKQPEEENKKEENINNNNNNKQLKISKSRPDLSIEIESKGQQQVLSGVHLTESKSDKEHSLSLDLEFRPKGEKSLKGKIPMFGSMRDNGGGSLSASGSLGSPSIVGDNILAVGSLRNEPPNSLRKNNEGSKKKEILVNNNNEKEEKIK